MQARVTAFPESIEGNLAVCPNELLALDPSAAVLWPIFLRRVGLHMNSRGEVIENDGRRAWIVRNFGIPSLERHLNNTSDERSRARVWWREMVACSEGESDIPDLSNFHVLNPFIVTPELKYADPRAERLMASRQRGRPAKSEEEKRKNHAARQRAYRLRKERDSQPGNALEDDLVTV